jgi:hypothetical protein
METPAAPRSDPSLEDKVDALSEKVSLISRRQRLNAISIVAGMLLLLLCSPPALALYRLLIEHLSLEAVINEGFVALVAGLIGALLGRAKRSLSVPKERNR